MHLTEFHLLGMGLSINGQHVYCGDYIYSGHTVILTVSSLLIQEYTPRKWRPLHWLSWLVTFLGVVFVMVAHGHYTVDVLIAYYVTTRIFWMYHTMANNSILKVGPVFTHLQTKTNLRIFVSHSNVARPTIFRGYGGIASLPILSAASAVSFQDVTSGRFPGRAIFSPNTRIVIASVVRHRTTPSHTNSPFSCLHLVRIHLVKKRESVRYIYGRKTVDTAKSWTGMQVSTSHFCLHARFQNQWQECVRLLSPVMVKTIFGCRQIGLNNQEMKLELKTV